MAQKLYPSVEQAIQNKDYELLRSLGRLGGLRSGKRRKAASESRKRLEQLEAGTIGKQAKKRIPKKVPHIQSHENAGERRIEDILEAYRKECLLRDARRHQMRNLAGTSPR